MIEITKKQVDFLIAKGYLRQEKGKYIDLVILNHGKGKKRKKRLVPWTYERWLRL